MADHPLRDPLGSTILEPPLWTNLWAPSWNPTWWTPLGIALVGPKLGKSHVGEPLWETPFVDPPLGHTLGTDLVDPTWKPS